MNTSEFPTTFSPSTTTSSNIPLTLGIIFGAIGAITSIILAAVAVWNCRRNHRQGRNQRGGPSLNTQPDVCELDPLLPMGTCGTDQARRDTGTSGQHVPPEDSSPAPQNLDSVQLAAANRCAVELRQLYKTEGSRVRLNPFVDDDSVDVTDIFTKLQLCTENKGMSTGTDTAAEGSVSFEKMFNLKPKRAILNGLAGNGKTTLLGKVTYDWALKKVMKRFKLVFLLKMNELDESSNLIDSIFNQPLTEDTKVNKGDLKLFIENNSEEVLILLDGFDELRTTSLHEDKFGSILKMLNRKVLRECWVVITTRPSHFHKLVTKSLIKVPYTHVNVLGFGREGTNEYVRKFYVKKPEKIDGLLKRIKSSFVLSNLATNPMLLLLLCLQWRVGSKLPETLWGIYSQAVTYLFERKRYFSSEEIPGIVIEIGKIGLDGLLSPDQVLLFDESELERSVPVQNAIKAGILTIQRTFQGIHPRNSIQFMHKTIQEFCAAKYFQCLLKTDFEYTRTLQIFSTSLKDNIFSLEYLLRFCCGDNVNCMIDIVQTYGHLSGIKSERDEDYLVNSILHCYFEGQSINSLLGEEQIINLIIKDQMRISYDSHDDHVVFMHFMKCLADEPSGRGKTLLSKVHEVNVKSKHYIGDCFFEDVADILEVLTCMNKLVALNLSENAFGGLSSSMDEHLKKVKFLQRLGIQSRSRMNLEEYDGEEIGNYQSVYQIDDFVLSWSHHLKTLTSLQRLDINACFFSSTGINHVVKALSCMTKLVELNLSYNFVVDDDLVVSLCHNFKQLKSLQTLHMHNCRLTNKYMEDIGEALSCMTNLVDLVLGSDAHYENYTVSMHNNFSGLGVSWIHHLQKLTSLQVLDISSCSLTGEDMNCICEALGFLNMLIELRLEGNYFGDSLVSWSHQLMKLTSLQILDIGYCKLQDEDINHISVVLDSMNNLVELDLQYNDLSGSSVSRSDTLKLLNSLQRLVMQKCRLNITNCCLTNEDKRYISKGESTLDERIVM